MSSITNDATSSSINPKVVEPSSSFSSILHNIIMSFLAFISRFFFPKCSNPPLPSPLPSLSPVPLHVPSPSSFLSLPEQIILNCLARISKSNYPNLSLVSKSFEPLLSSSGLYKTRCNLKTTERFIYICIWFPTLKSHRWFSLLMSPNQTLTGKARNNILVPIPYSQSFPVSKSNVAVGSEIYVLGGATNDVPSSAVRVIECHSHTWRDAPSMMVPRKDAVVGVLNGKIYVLGGCEEDESVNWGEVFDTKTQTWEPLPNPPNEVRRDVVKRMVEFQGKFYVKISRVGSYVYVYDPEEGRWECCGGKANHWKMDKACYVIENVVYCYGSFSFNWYDMESKMWKNVKGLEKLQSKFHSSCGLRVRGMFGANNGEKLVMFWDGVGLSGLSPSRKKKIWCAEIEFEKRDGYEIWGKVEWIDDVLTVPNLYEFMCCLSISV